MDVNGSANGATVNSIAHPEGIDLSRHFSKGTWSARSISIEVTTSTRTSVTDWTAADGDDMGTIEEESSIQVAFAAVYEFDGGDSDTGGR